MIVFLFVCGLTVDTLQVRVVWTVRLSRVCVGFEALSLFSSGRDSGLCRTLSDVSDIGQLAKCGGSDIVNCLVAFLSEIVNSTHVETTDLEN